MKMRHVLLAIVVGILCGLLLPMPWSFIISGIGGGFIGWNSDKIDKFFGWND